MEGIIIEKEERELLSNALIAAVGDENLDAVVKCIELGADIYFNKYEALRKAIFKHYFEIADIIIEKGFDFDKYADVITKGIVLEDDDKALEWIIDKTKNYTGKNHVYINIALRGNKIKTAKYLYKCYEKDEFDIFGYISNNEEYHTKYKEKLLKTLIEEV